MDKAPSSKPMLSGRSELAELGALVDATERMLALARAGEWEAVAELESGRSARLETFFNALDQTTRERHVDQLRQAVEYILGADKEIMTLGEATKSDAAASLQQRRSARKATAVYQENNDL